MGHEHKNQCSGFIKQSSSCIGTGTWTRSNAKVQVQVQLKFRVATAQGKQGIRKSIFPHRENTGNLLKNIKNMFLHRKFTTNIGKIMRVEKIMNL